MKNLPPDIAAKLQAVAEHMPTMQRRDLEAALLAYSLYFLTITQATTALMNTFPEENQGLDIDDVKFWGPEI